MITPTVTELPRTLNAVGHDTFIDGAVGSMTRVRPASSASARLRIVGPSHGQITRGPAGASLARRRATTLVHAA